nr:type VI secretion system baseplate subunit TssK [Burkholderia diffusa]
MRGASTASLPRPLWEEVVRHGGLALHVAGDFPSLKLELWGVRT